MSATEALPEAVSSKERGILHEISNDSSRSVANELLAITDSAVKSLHGYNSDTNHTGVQYGELHLFSPSPIDIKALDNVAPSDTIPKENFHRTSDASHNTSLSSIKSASSSRNSSFQSTSAKHVKISAKKLREIKSPFEKTNDSLVSSTGTVGHGSEGRHIEGGSANQAVVVQKHFSNGSQDLSMSEVSKKPTAEGTLSDDGAPPKAQIRTTTDSGYLTEKLKATKSPNATQEDIISLPDDDFKVHGTLGVSVQPTIQTVPEQVDIITVQENIVTINAQNSVSSSSYCSTDSAKDEDSFKGFHAPFTKASHPSTLRQGCLSTAQTDKKQEPEVTVASYLLNTKQRKLKENFVRRQIPGAVKKKVRPTVVHKAQGDEVRATKETAATTSSSMPIDQDSVTKTAAIAAASAVAATQPFIMAQQSVELRLAELLDKLGHATVPGDLQVQEIKMRELEAQIQALTQQRLDYLEQQQLQQQAHLMSVAQTKAKPVSTPVKYEKASSPNREGALLSTPAPRRGPPQPALYTKSTPEKTHQAGGGGGILEQILQQDESTQLHSPFRATPERSGVNKPPMLQQELADLKREITHAIADAKHWSSPSSTAAAVGPRSMVDTAPYKQAGHKHAGHKQPPRRPLSPSLLSPDPVTAMPVKTGPAPLDLYMKRPENPAQSPYPSRTKIHPKSSQDDLAVALATLRQVEQSRRNLEDNLDTMIKSRNRRPLTGDPSVTSVESMRITGLVDDHIAAMSTDLQHEILSELQRMEEERYMIPERDIPPPAKRGRGGAGKVTAGKVTARIDSGIRMPGKENKPKAKPFTKPTYSKPAPRSVSRPIPQRQPFSKQAGRPTSKPAPSQPYGAKQRGAQAAGRRPVTAKQPPPARGTREHRFPVATQKQHATAHPPPPAEDVSTQQRRNMQTGGPAFFYENATGSLVPVAIPLGLARQQGGLKAAVTIETLPSPPRSPRRQPHSPRQRTPSPRRPHPQQSSPSRRLSSPPHSTPLGHQHRTGTATEDIEASPSLPTSVEVSKLPLHNVSISTISHSSPRQEEISSIEPSQAEEEEEEDEEIELAYPGYSAPEPRPYHGPAFPPQAPPLIAPPPRDSEAIAADVRDRDLLQDKAVQWVEQELMARVISEVYSKRAAQRDHLDTVDTNKPKKKKPQQQQDSDDDDEVTVSELSEVSAHDSMIADVLGPAGMQLFVDVGAPVDDGMVADLVKTVLLEKIQGMLGDHRDGQPQREARPQQRVVITQPRSPRRQPSQPSPPLKLKMPGTPIMTPEPTPKGSPVYSPVHRHPSPPAAPITPDLTPVQSMASPPPPQRVIPPVESEDESSHEGAYRKATAKYQQAPRSKIPEDPDDTQYDLMTPEHTPVPSPPPISRTPSPSVREPTPPPPPPPAPEPEPEPEVEEEEEPKPWGDPESPVSEAVPAAPRTPTPPPQEEEVEPVIPSPEPDSSEHLPPPSSSTYTEETETEESYTNPDAFSEGQWLLSVASEGEVQPTTGHVDADLHARVRQKLLESHGRQPHGRRGRVDDSVNEQPDMMDQEASEGEFLAGGAAQGEDDEALLLVLARERARRRQQQAMDAGYILPATGLHKEVAAPVVDYSNDYSIGEVSVGQRPRVASDVERIMYNHPSQADDSMPGFVLRERRLTDDEDEVARPQSSSARRAGKPLSASGHRVIMSKPISSTRAPREPARGAREPARQQREQRDPVMTESRESGLLTTTVSETSEDRINVQVLLASQNYYPTNSLSEEGEGVENGAGTLEDDMNRAGTLEEGSGTYERRARGTLEEGSGTYERRGRGTLEEGSGTYERRGQGTLEEGSGTYERRGRGTLEEGSGTYERRARRTLGSTMDDDDMGEGRRTYGSTSGRQSGYYSTMGSSMSDISLPPGLTHTMERSASADLSHERHSAGPEEQGEEGEDERVPLQVSVTLPSMADESDDDDNDDDDDDEEDYDDMSPRVQYQEYTGVNKKY